MKRFISMILVTFLLVGALSVCLTLGVGAESLYIKKIVSVVYDDSVSMRFGSSPNWAYASYAMQAFCGHPIWAADQAAEVSAHRNAEKQRNEDFFRVIRIYFWENVIQERGEVCICLRE